MRVLKYFLTVSYLFVIVLIETLFTGYKYSVQYLVIFHQTSIKRGYCRWGARGSTLYIGHRLKDVETLQMYRLKSPIQMGHRVSSAYEIPLQVQAVTHSAIPTRHSSFTADTSALLPVMTTMSGCLNLKYSITDAVNVYRSFSAYLLSRRLATLAAR